MTDTLWERYSLGTEYNAKDPATQQPAIRNPFLHRAPSPAPGITRVEDAVDELDGFLQVILWSPAATIASAFINGFLNVVGG